MQSVVAAVPAAVALSASALASAGEDAELLAVGGQCKGLALETARLGRFCSKAYRQMERALYKMKPEKWLYRETMRQAFGPNAWDAQFIDSAPDHFDIWLDIEPPERLPTKWISLTAKNREDAEIEAKALDRKFVAEFNKKRDQAGVPFNRGAHYKNWTRSHHKLALAVARLARFKAATVEGLNMKAMVLAIAHEAFDDPNIWNEPLQKSITRDIKRMA